MEVEAGLIRVQVNGEMKEVPPNESVAGLLAFLDLPGDRLAVEIDRALVRKRDWPKVLVQQGARIEIVEFVGGG